MKKVFLVCVLVCLTQIVFAQKKKEMVATINELRTSVDSLQEVTSSQSETINTLKIELEDCKSTILQLQENMHSLQQSTFTMKQSLASLRERQDSLILQQNALPKSSLTLVTAKDSVVDFFIRYLACENWEDLLNYIVEPNRMKPIMKKYYDLNNHETLSYDPTIIKNAIKNVRPNVYVVNSRDWGCQVSLYYIVKTKEGYKVDWEASFMPYMPVGGMMVGETTTEWITIRDRYETLLYNNKYVEYNDNYVLKDSSLDKRLRTLLHGYASRNIIVKKKLIEETIGTGKNARKRQLLVIIDIIAEDWCRY